MTYPKVFSSKDSDSRVWCRVGGRGSAGVWLRVGLEGGVVASDMLDVSQPIMSR